MRDEFKDRISYMTYKDICTFYRIHKVVELNNVIEGFKSLFFTIAFTEEESLNDYSLIFIGNQPEISGLVLKSGRNLKNRDEYTLRFARAIENEFPKLNSLEIFNTFQSKVQQVYENYGIVCIPEYIFKFGSSISILLPFNKHGVDRILRIDIWSFYKSFFERNRKVFEKDKSPKIYLMYDRKENLIKIGETKGMLKKRKKDVAEATLRGIDPMIELITAWEAPKEIENKLHEYFNSKRTRGEWFKLKAIDIEEIDKVMSKFEMIYIN